MKSATITLDKTAIELSLPDRTNILSMSVPETIENPEEAIQEALDDSIGSPGLNEVVKRKLQENPSARAVIVISDNTRPVPYTGSKGILWPVVERLLSQGMKKEQILVIVGLGTHRPLTEVELRDLLDPRVFDAGVRIQNHDCQDTENLTYLGETARGSTIYINRFYMEADIKILTGLVESHFMAGVSGGRKSVLPALAGEKSTYIFHGPDMLGSPNARDLVLEDNPCHEESLEMARKAGVDYIVNVTLDESFDLTGVFAGDLEAAHEAAVRRIREYVAIPIDRTYDLVVTHAGYVGINHYQACKAAVVAGYALKPGGRLILVGSNTDTDPVGSPKYRSVLYLLKFMGPKRFNRLIRSPDWTFIPEQWQVQMWAKLFEKLPMENFTYYSPHIPRNDWLLLPGRDGNRFLPGDRRYGGTLDHAAEVIEKAVSEDLRQLGAEGREDPDVVFLKDGPYGIPVPD